MKTEYSLGIVHKNQQQRKSDIAEHDNRLRAALTEACEAAGIPDGKAAPIIQGGMARFSISSEGIVKPLSSYPDFESFIEQHRATAPSSRMSALEVADKKAMQKQQLFEQLQHFASIGDMKGYRSARSAWAAL